MEKFLVESMTIDLARSKNSEYRVNLIACKKALYCFLYKEGLLEKNPLTPDGTLKINFEIYSDDLTATGLELFRKPIQSWYKARAKDRNFDNLKILEKALGKMTLPTRTQGG